MNRLIRSLLVIFGAVGLLAAAAFFLQMDWMTGLWPWPAYRLGNIFIASILAAASAPVMWIGLSGELAAITGGALNFLVTYGGMAAYTFGVYLSGAGRTQVLVFAVICALFAIVCLALILWARRMPFHDVRPTPRAVRISFGAFIVVLLLAGGSLVLKTSNIFPWFLSSEQSVLYGWIFLGAALYFAYGVFKPVWGNAVGQLLGFLAYDLVLIVPFLRHFAVVNSDLRINLTVYTAVLIYSGLLAAYFLFVNRATRFSAGSPEAAPTTA
ncbi:MAG: hypothetical protein KDH08_23670 [Anaerolineae bacterium]|nr:hypothetical protein [Caldilinea sp.]MCB0241558.1 hypothetical protein [Anaerolineae bacterium]